jgi:hypothetical protein
MDELIVEELIENIQLFNQKLVEGVDDCTHHSDSMGLDGVQHLVDTYRLDLLGLGRDLYENLCVNIVAVLAHEFAEVSQQL